ncbi:NADP-dependent oxidoreductase [Microbacterium sp. No. 7]|uniref:NADP-dependent oxidoreductase n=1 Tax=Microbacterium sp. No. 7 TaxID=1714373 RepID=UPI0006CFD4EA|nr:NADP-dependent oxidoreductase [Microbacterium sp. No. 7]
MACDGFGDPDVVYETDVELPPVGPQGVLVRMAYASVNPGDTRLRRGSFSGRARHHFPLVLGLDGSGVVEQVGASGSPFSVGQAVYGFFLHDYVGDGTYAEYASTRSSRLAPVPAGVSMRDAAAVACAGGTAMVLVEELAQVASGSRVLVAGASGGVGHFAVQLAAAAGAEVIAVARSEHHRLMRSLGAAHAIDYRDPSLPAIVTGVAPGGVDAAIDTVGGESQLLLSRLVREGGRIASCVHPAQSDAFARRGQVLEYRFFEATPSRMARLTRLLSDGGLHPHISLEYELDEVATAHRMIEAGGVAGKILLSIGGETVTALV